MSTAYKAGTTWTQLIVLTLYETAKARLLEPDCARWLEEGGDVPAMPCAG